MSLLHLGVLIPNAKLLTLLWVKKCGWLPLSPVTVQGPGGRTRSPLSISGCSRCPTVPRALTPKCAVFHPLKQADVSAQGVCNFCSPSIPQFANGRPRPLESPALPPLRYHSCPRKGWELCLGNLAFMNEVYRPPVRWTLGSILVPFSFQVSSSLS